MVSGNEKSEWLKVGSRKKAASTRMIRPTSCSRVCQVGLKVGVKFPQVVPQTSPITKVSSAKLSSIFCCSLGNALEMLDQIVRLTCTIWRMRVDHRNSLCTVAASQWNMRVFHSIGCSSLPTHQTAQTDVHQPLPAEIPSARAVLPLP